MKREIWKKWGQKSQVKMEAWRSLLPEISEAQADFSVAQALREAALHGEWRQKAEAKKDLALLGSDFTEARKTLPVLWGAKGNSARRTLLSGVKKWPEAPWRRWSAAGDCAHELEELLDGIGFMEPWQEGKGLANLGVMLRGFKASASQRLAALAKRSAPEALMQSTGDRPFSSILWTLANAQGGDQQAANRSPMDEFYRASVNAGSQWEGARTSDFSRTCLSAKNLGLGLSFEHPWVLEKCFFWRLGQSVPKGSWEEERQANRAFAKSLIDLGASAQDWCVGNWRVWESWAAPTAETGSEGYYIMLEDEDFSILFSAGADFRKTGLGASAAFSPVAQKRKEQALSSAYGGLLQGDRRAEACALAQKWENACKAREEARAMEKVLAKPKGRSARKRV